MAKPRKVVRTKNLYKKNVIPPKVAGVLLFIALILFIVIVGFVLMHEMTIRFNESSNTPNNESLVVEDDIHGGVTPPIVEDIIIEEVEDIEISKMSFVDSATISNGKSAIENKLKEIIDDNFTTVAFELKPYTGKLSYNSDVSLAYKYDAIDDDNGLLSLQEIIDIAYEYEITPIAYMSTLQDQTTAHVDNGNSYAYSTYTSTNWLDNSVDAGGKSWLNPYMENTQEYISQLVEEMYNAGFKVIFLDNVIFPTKNTGMMNTIKTTPSKEQMLTDFVTIVQDFVPDATIYRVEDITFTATIDEITNSSVSTTNYNTVLSRCETENIAVFMSLDDISNRKEQIILRESLSLDNKADNIDVFKELLEKTIAVFGFDFVLVIDEKDFLEVTPVLEEVGIVNFIVTN